MTRIQANLVLLLAGAMWGMGFVAQATAMDELGPYTFIGLRFLAATLSMLPFVVWEAKRSRESLARRDLMRFCVIGVVLFAGMAAQQIGLMTTSVTNSGFLTGLYVVMVPLLVVLWFREWPHPVVWAGVLLAMTGIFMFSGGEIAAFTVGDWLTILCAFFWAVQMILIARWARDSGRPITLAVIQFAVCAALGLAVALLTETIAQTGLVAALPEILYAGVFSGGVAFTLQAIGQRYTTASQAALFLSSESVFAALFGSIVLGERLGPLGYLGCLLIFAAILAVEIVPGLGKSRTA